MINVHNELETALYDRFCTYVMNEELTAPYDKLVRLLLINVHNGHLLLMENIQHYMIDFVQMLLMKNLD